MENTRTNPVAKQKLTCSIQEMGRMLGISTDRAYVLARSEGFPVVQVGGRRLVSIKGLERWVDRQAEGVTHEN